MNLSDFVRNHRKDMALTQVEFAKILKISSGTVCNLELGKSAGPKVLKALAKYFKMETRILRKMMEEKNEFYK